MSKTRRSPSLGLIVLAGGLSTRMGRDKAGLPWHDTDLLTDLLLRSQAYPFSERIIAINRPYTPHELPAKLGRTVHLVADSYPGCGPLGGLEAALHSGTSEFYLVLSVDLPFYNFAPVPDLVKLLRHQPDLLAVIPRTENKQDQPLAALYSRQLLPAVADHLQKGEYRLRRLYQAVPAAYVDESFRPALYLNINTPEAYEAAKGRDANSCRQVPVVTLTAPDSGDGKTTAATAAIAELTRRGYQVAYIKSTHHIVTRQDWVRHGPGPKSRRRLGLSLRPGRCPRRPVERRLYPRPVPAAAGRPGPRRKPQPRTIPADRRDPGRHRDTGR